MAERGDFCRMPLRLVAKACAAICERSVLKFDFELQRIDVHISALPENQFRGGPCSLSGEGEIRERVEDDLWPHVQSTNRTYQMNLTGALCKRRVFLAIYSVNTLKGR